MTDDTTTWEGADALRSRLVPISSLTRHPDNPRHGDVEEISKSLARFGQVRPILVHDGIVVAGNHTLIAAEQLEWTHVAVIENEFASADEARAYLLADNRLADIGEYDQAELLSLVSELEEWGRWDGTGYTPDDLDHMRALEASRDTILPPAPVAITPLPADPSFREVVLLFDEEHQQQFGAAVRTLQTRYDADGITDTVLRALRDEALLVNQGTAP